ncbi:MAG TPA: hypothetical protein VKZ57_08090 [Sphingobacterium sp.]|jgi:hypothetical protein|nr:hypothetical protein [Sphingobacterium sp.]
MKHHPIFQKANIWQRELINRAVVKKLNDLPTIPFHRDMLWPEATLSHTRKIIEELNLEKN